MSPKAIKILRVEGDYEDLLKIRDMLDHLDEGQFQIIHGSPLSKAFKLLIGHDFDIILLDLSRSDIHGLETIKKIHTDAPDIPLVVLADQHDKDFALQTLQMGAQNYLVKGPLCNDLLILALHYAIERKNKEKTLKKKEKDLAEAQRLARIDSWRWNVASNKVTWSEELCRIYGLKPEEFGATCEAYLNYVHPEDREPVKAIIEKRMRDHQPYSFIGRIVRSDGAVRIIQSTGEVIVDKSGRLIGILGAGQDIAGQKQTEETLKQNHHLLHAVIQGTTDAIYVKNLQGRYLMINSAGAGFLGKAVEQVIGRDDTELFSPETAHHLREYDSRVKHAGGTQTFEEIVTAAGVTRTFLTTKTPYRDYQGNIVGVFGISRDITERKREEELLKIQKLQSLGLLAEGIAHDFNNLLTGILGNISLAKTWLSPEDRVFNRLTEAEKGSLRAKDLAQQLLTFAKGGAPVKKIASIKGLLEHSVQVALRGSNIRSEFSFKEDLWPVEIDESQIGQVIQNLVINAQQAMAQGGIIRVQAENLTDRDDQKNGPPVKKGKYVKISVEDHGVGIPKEDLSKIFDPYFTTKIKGNGLGLAISYSIIQRHDGHITVESEPGTGTTFCLYLRASSQMLIPKKNEEDELTTEKGVERV